jgi:hypothetical protein
MTPVQMKRLAKLEAAAPTGVGNWVIGISGNLIWDPSDFPEPSEDEANAAKERMLRQLDQIAERMQSQPDYVPPTEKQKREAGCALAEMCERMQAEKRGARVHREDRARAGGAAGQLFVKSRFGHAARRPGKPCARAMTDR